MSGVGRSRVTARLRLVNERLEVVDGNTSVGCFNNLHSAPGRDSLFDNPLLHSPSRNADFFGQMTHSLVSVDIYGTRLQKKLLEGVVGVLGVLIGGHVLLRDF